MITKIHLKKLLPATAKYTSKKGLLGEAKQGKGQGSKHFWKKCRKTSVSTLLIQLKCEKNSDSALFSLCLMSPNIAFLLVQYQNQRKNQH